MANESEQEQFERILRLQKEYNDIFFSDPEKLEQMRQKLVTDKEFIINECVSDRNLNDPNVSEEDKDAIRESYDDVIFSLQEKINIMDDILSGRI